MANTLKNQLGLKQLNSHTYSFGYDTEWTIGPVLHGGIVAAIIYSAAQAHFNTTLATHKQPDVHTLNLIFPRGCTATDSTVKVTDIKTGKGACFIRLDLSQDGQLKATALASSIDFSVFPGPSAKTKIPFSPPLPPKPDFAKIEAQLPDGNWLPSKTVGEIFPFTKRFVHLYPAEGQNTPGIIDSWCAFDRPELFDGAHLAMLGDLAPSMPDTLLQTGGIFDAHRLYRQMRATGMANPGQTTIFKPTLKDAMKAVIWNATLALDLQFKRRMPEEEMTWTFTRVMTRSLEGGRMDLDLAIYDRDLEPICLARQVVQVIDARRRFKRDAGSEAAKL